MKAPIHPKKALPALIALCSVHSPHTVPLLRAAYEGVISLVTVLSGQTVHLAELDRARLPSITLLGDDQEAGVPDGPGVWPQYKALARWAQFTVINTADGDMQDYVYMVHIACEVRKLLVVETTTERMEEWNAAVSKAGGAS